MQRGRWGAGLLAALAVLVAGGCSSVIAGSPTAQGPGGTGGFLPSPPPTSAGPTEVATTGDASFSSPTSNIGCMVYDRADLVEARCDIGQKRWQPPPKRADCPVEYGQGLSLGDTAALVCAGDTALGATKLLAYGSAIKVGRFLCTSRESGMTCENTLTAHGFELSQAAYRIF